MTDDLYEILGVLPSAEDIVITAAYRVLAQRYHPDRWMGPPAEAHERMTAINRAYETLKNSARRAAYDAQRKKDTQASYEQQQDQGREAVFQQAINDLEARWKIATDVFPDLHDLRAKLAKLSSALAFSYVTTMLERKAFNDRQVLGERMQNMFLERYFGTDQSVKDFALELIQLELRDAAKLLNEMVDVLGSKVAAGHLIDRVKKIHGQAISEARLRQFGAQNDVRYFQNRFQKDPTLRNLRILCNCLNTRIAGVGRGLFQPLGYEVTLPTGQSLTFNSEKEVIVWAKKEFS